MVAPVRFRLPPDGPQHDLLYSDAIRDNVQAYLDGRSQTVDLEASIPGSGTTIWVRVTPSHTRPNGTNNEMWHFDGTCELLDDDLKPALHGLQGTCNGWISVVRNPNAVAGKISMQFPNDNK